MPSPLTHIAAGYAIYRIAGSRLSMRDLGRFWKFRSMPLLVIGAAVLPDLDSITGWLLGDFGRYHNQGSHSLISGLAAAFLLAGAVHRFGNGSFRLWFFILLGAYESHVLLDAFTFGRGVMLFWPFSVERFSPPFLLFYGLRWSQGFFSIHHLWTFLTEAGIIAAVFLLIKGLQLAGRKIGIRTPKTISGRNYPS